MEKLIRTYNPIIKFSKLISNKKILAEFEEYFPKMECWTNNLGWTKYNIREADPNYETFG